MADVTTTFAAKDEGFAATMTRMQARLAAFTKGMNSVKTQSAGLSTSFTTMAKSLAGLGAAYLGVSTAISSFNKALDMAGSLNDLSVITGESAGELAVLQRAFQNTGNDADKLLPMITKMTKFITDLGEGNKGAEATAKMLGVSFSQLKGMAPVERFKTLLQAVNGLSDENKKLNGSMDVFGTKMGGKLIPLAQEFTGNISEARGELGSMVRLLNENAAALDQLGDKLKNAVGEKLTELAFGFLTATTGSNDLVKSMANIDAAGIGEGMGQAFMGALKQPEQAFLAFGEILLLGVVKAGNYLINATIHAAKVYADALTKKELWMGVSELLQAAIFGVADLLTKVLLSAIKTAILDPLASLPSVFGGDAFSFLRDQFSEVQKGFDKSFQDNINDLGAAASKIGGAIGDSMRDIPKVNADHYIFGEDNQRKEVAGAIDALQRIGGKGQPRSQAAGASAGADAKNDLMKEQQATAQRQANETNLRKSYEEQAQRLREANISAASFTKRMNALNQWFNQEMQGNAAPSKPTQQMQDSQMSDSERSEATRKGLSTSAAASPENKLASETTLQKAVRFLEDLTTKLPAPVLV
jgi:hypothetical protein